MPAESTAETSPPANSPAITHSEGRSAGFWIVTALVIALLVLHQDNWFWTDSTLVLGILPIGLFWHGCISIAASITWYIATKIAWPLDDDQPLPPDNRDLEAHP